MKAGVVLLAFPVFTRMAPGKIPTASAQGFQENLRIGRVAIEIIDPH